MSLTQTVLFLLHYQNKKITQDLNLTLAPGSQSKAAKMSWWCPATNNVTSRGGMIINNIANCNQKKTQLIDRSIVSESWLSFMKIIVIKIWRESWEQWSALVLLPLTLLLNLITFSVTLHSCFSCLGVLAPLHATANLAVAYLASTYALASLF